MIDESADQDSTDLQKCIKCAQELIASRPEELRGASIFAAGKCLSCSPVSLLRHQPWTPRIEGKLYGMEKPSRNALMLPLRFKMIRPM